MVLILQSQQLPLPEENIASDALWQIKGSSLTDICKKYLIPTLTFHSDRLKD